MPQEACELLPGSAVVSWGLGARLGGGALGRSTCCVIPRRGHHSERAGGRLNPPNVVQAALRGPPEVA